MSLTNKFNLDQEGVSPVVGVILMVAITVILAAVIGTFVLGLGDQVNQNAQAGVTFDEDVGNEVVIQLNSVQAADHIYVDSSASGSPSDGALPDPTAQDSSYDATKDGQYLLTEYATNDTEVGGVGQTVVANASGAAPNNAYAAGEQLTVIGVLEGEENIIQTYTMG